MPHVRRTSVKGADWRWPAVAGVGGHCGPVDRHPVHAVEVLGLKAPDVAAFAAEPTCCKGLVRRWGGVCATNACAAVHGPFTERCAAEAWGCVVQACAHGLHVRKAGKGVGEVSEA